MIEITPKKEMSGFLRQSLLSKHGLILDEPMDFSPRAKLIVSGEAMMGVSSV